MIETKRISDGGLKPVEIESFSEKMHVLKCLVHCADLSNPTRPLDLYEQWVNRLMEEFFRQVSYSKCNNIDTRKISEYFSKLATRTLHLVFSLFTLKRYHLHCSKRFFIEYLFYKCGQLRRTLWAYLNLRKKSLMEKFFLYWLYDCSGFVWMREFFLLDTDFALRINRYQWHIQNSVKLVR